MARHDSRVTRVAPRPGPLGSSPSTRFAKRAVQHAHAVKFRPLLPSSTLLRAACMALVLCTPFVPCRAADEPPAGQAAEPAFDIWEYEIDGNSVLSVEDIERAVQPYLGPGQSMKAVEAARLALEAVYQQAGYLTVLV